MPELTIDAKLAKAEREVLILRQGLRDLLYALGVYEGARSATPQDHVGAGVAYAGTIRRQNARLKEALEVRAGDILATSSA